MKLVRIGPAGEETPAVLADDGTLLDLTGLADDIDGAMLAAGLGAIREAVVGDGLPRLSPPGPGPGERFGPPVTGIGKVVCVGLNYADHAAETGTELPSEPVLFLKATDTVTGPYDEVLVPRTSERTDYEVELAVVIGQTARYLAAPDDAAAVIAGYTISNDVSERAFQLDRAASGTRGSAARRSTPSVLGSSRPTRCPTRRRSACGCGSMASSDRRAPPPTWPSGCTISCGTSASSSCCALVTSSTRVPPQASPSDDPEAATCGRATRCAWRSTVSASSSSAWGRHERPRRRGPRTRRRVHG